MRQAEFTDSNLDFDTRIVDIADHLDNAGNRLRVAGRLRDQFGIDNLACLGITGRTFYQNVVDDTLVFRSDQPDTCLLYTSRRV